MTNWSLNETGVRWAVKGEGVVGSAEAEQHEKGDGVASLEIMLCVRKRAVVKESL